jgi:hypothetical protein
MTDLTGNTYGKLTVVSRAKNKGRHIYWLCKCECGNTKEVKGDHLKSGSIKSCGCIVRKHGKEGTRLYNIWQSMLHRCENPKDKSYSDYGGRGITVCEEWHDIETFFAWAAASGYTDDLTIDRKDNNGNYEPSNCRWATRKEQANNRRSNHLLTCFGETHNIEEWAAIMNLPASKIENRINKLRWSVKRALTTP